MFTWKEVCLVENDKSQCDSPRRIRLSSKNGARCWKCFGCFQLLRITKISCANDLAWKTFMRRSKAWCSLGAESDSLAVLVWFSLSISMWCVVRTESEGKYSGSCCKKVAPADPRERNRTSFGWRLREYGLAGLSTNGIWCTRGC